ncbi:protein of unknown function DUF2236 [Trinorchestia longiramus]|nr:protein of unknown function DUF2236 [Trinorchestia longiramus]
MESRMSWCAEVLWGSTASQKQSARRKHGTALCIINLTLKYVPVNAQYLHRSDTQRSGPTLFKDMTVNMSGNQLEKLRRGKDIPGHFDVAIAKPEWYDERKFLRGKKFFRENLISVFLSDVMYMFMVFSYPTILKVFISTEKSSCPTTALRRYVPTLRVIMSWFQGDIWDPNDPACKSLLYVMKTHKHIYKVTNFNKKEGIDAIEIPKPPIEERSNVYWNVKSSERSLSDDVSNNCTYVSQWDLMVVQHAMIGGPVAHPEAFGAWDVDEEDIEGYIHCWRVLGHLMGIGEEFNLCNGDLKHTKILLNLMEEQEIIPSFGNVGYNFEHMSLAFINGMNILVPGLMYPPTLLYFLVTLGADSSRLSKSLTFREKISYYSMIAITYSCKAKFIRNLWTSLLEISLDLIEGSGPWWWPSFCTPSMTIPRSRFLVS